MRSGALWSRLPWTSRRRPAVPSHSPSVAAEPAWARAERVSGRQLRAEDGRYFSAVAWSDGSVSIEVQDLTPPPFMGCDEYEYALNVVPADVPRLRVALGGGPEDDAVELLAARTSEVLDFGRDARARGVAVETVGPQGWFDHHGIPVRFWSRLS